jgi:competence protein ComEC
MVIKIYMSGKRFRLSSFPDKTHLHPDHASGYFRIREAFPKARIHDNGDPAALESHIDMVRWTASALQAEQHREVLRAAAGFDWLGVTITTLWPHRVAGDDLNRNSLVLRIGYRCVTALLMGDTGQEVERRLLDDGSLIRHIDLLIAGHHGSSQTSREAFLQALTPRHCVISVNRGNIRGYPDPSTLQRLNNACGRLYRTDLDGDVRLTWQDGEADKGKPVCP